MKTPLRLDRFKVTRFVGVVLLLAGALFQVVESFVLNPHATKLLVDQYAASSSTPQSTIQRFIVDSGSRRATVTPPEWVRWSTLSAGAIALAYGVWGSRWK